MNVQIAIEMTKGVASAKDASLLAENSGAMLITKGVGILHRTSAAILYGQRYKDSREACYPA